MSGVIVLLLAAVFLIAAIAKLQSQNEFGEVLQNLIPTSMVRPAAIAVPLSELALAVFLLSGITPRAAILAAMAVLLVFTGFLALMWRRGLKGCGCFGENPDTATNGNGIVRNLILITLAGYALAVPQMTPVFGPDISTFFGRLTVVIGTLCLWPCLVGLFERRKLIFNFIKT